MSGPTSGGERGSGAELAVALALLGTVAGGIGLVVVYLRGGQPQLEGLFLGGALVGLAFALGLWAHHFLPGGDAVEPRHQLASSEVERRSFVERFEGGERELTRRGLLVKLLGLGVAALGAAALFPLRSLGPRPGRSLRTTAWGRGKRLVTEDGTPVRAADVPVDAVLTVFPEGSTLQDRADSQTLLIGVRPGCLRPAPGREDWAPGGLVAYSKVCTHAGCPVGLYEAAKHRLVCPCHQSLFDVLDGAKPIFGPADRPLPQLPLEVGSDGYLRARGDFPDPVGPPSWEVP
ncbi:MAG: Rieske 2Fe-2S domain-containing protein [Actinobacteria bacterium]|nr:Rieske 2Fe-2S domain-containing protein [Actinomycetota bacterium]